MYQIAFPNFGTLDVVLPAGFIDESDPVRKMPTFTKVLANGNIMRLWVDFRDKAKSKYPNSPRFTISVYNSAFVRMHTDIEIDDWGHAQIYVMGLEQYNTPHQSAKG